MYTKLADVELKTGEKMEIGVIDAPEPEFTNQMIDVLGHKGDIWMWHLREVLKGNITVLETRFYVGLLDGKVIANIMDTVYNRTGILGHVFTRPEHRRKGVCTLLMKYKMEDFERRGGGILLLGTGFDSPAYWIYHSYGFRSLLERSGFMRYASEPDFEVKHFAPSKVKAVDVEWKHWPLMEVLISVPGIEIMRSVSLNLYGISSFEGGFLSFKRRLQEDTHTRAKLLESESGAVVGCANLELDKRWRGSTYLLDIFVHPNFTSHHGLLLNALELPKGKILCCVDATSPGEKIDALQHAGFEREGMFKNQFEWDGKRFDVLVYSRFNG